MNYSIFRASLMVSLALVCIVPPTAALAANPVCDSPGGGIGNTSAYVAQPYLNLGAKAMSQNMIDLLATPQPMPYSACLGGSILHKKKTQGTQPLAYYRNANSCVSSSMGAATLNQLTEETARRTYEGTAQSDGTTVYIGRIAMGPPSKPYDYKLTARTDNGLIKTLCIAEVDAATGVSSLWNGQ